MKRIVIAFVALLAIAGVTRAARAFDGHGATVTPPSSVFPVPRDPWRSWGVRQDVPQHVGPPPGTHHRVAAGPGVVWVPGQWVWDGGAWVWWPGRWVR